MVGRACQEARQDVVVVRDDGDPVGLAVPGQV